MTLENLNCENNSLNKDKNNEFIDSLQISIPLTEYSKLKREKIKFNNLWNSAKESDKRKVLIELNRIVYYSNKQLIDDHLKMNSSLYPVVQINFKVKEVKVLILTILKTIFNISVYIDIRIKDLELVGFKYKREYNDDSEVSTSNRVLSFLVFRGGSYE